jgi:hypothetical protein
MSVTSAIATARAWLAQEPRGAALAEEHCFLLSAVVRGLYAGVAVVCFRSAIDGARWQDCLARSSVAPELRPVSSELPQLHQQGQGMRTKMRTSALNRHHDLFVRAMDLAGTIEERTARGCGAPQGSDLALLLIARQREGAEP